MTAQIIFIAILLLDLVVAGYKHNKPKEGNYNMFADIFNIALITVLLYWGGFFDVLFK